MRTTTEQLEVLGCSIASNRLAVETQSIEQVIEVDLFPAPPGAARAFRFTAMVGGHAVVVLSPTATADATCVEAANVVILRSSNRRFRVGLCVDKVGRMMQVSTAEDSEVATDEEGGIWFRFGESGIHRVLRSGSFDYLTEDDSWVAS